MGKILAKDIVAEHNNSPFDRSPIDDYACRAKDLLGASLDAPIKLDVTTEIDVGMYFKQEVHIMTSAAIPAGCDCCIRQEDIDYDEKNLVSESLLLSLYLWSSTMQYSFRCFSINLDIQRFHNWLIENNCYHVCMESTGNY